MKELEQKTLDAKTEMAIADALDEVRTRNARRERADVDAVDSGIEIAMNDEEADRAEREIEEEARRAFQSGTGEKIKRLVKDDDSVDKHEIATPALPAPTFQRQVKKKKDFSKALGIKKKPTLV